MAKIININRIPNAEATSPNNSILIIVMAKPIQVTMVMAVPFSAGVALFATKEEKRGESPTTAKPQNSINTINEKVDCVVKKYGDTTQQINEASKNRNAVFLVPKCAPKYPAAMQPTAPVAIIMKLNIGKSNSN